MFEATLRNRSQLELGSLTISFPIPEERYENVIFALKNLQIGDERKQDCCIDSIRAPDCPALCRMSGTLANVDELDWLGRKLESFDQYELLQVSAAAERFGLCSADELVDLSFCANEMTVISDFSDLERVGRKHYLTVHGACDPKELENLDGKETALALISGQPGYVTRYGVVYDNGIKLEQAYIRRVLWSRACFRMELHGENILSDISPAVKKEYKKLYVAYKLDTNFVDIVFQKQRLRISINMKFSEINDPNGICKDITGLGRWGNGDVELFMEHQDELEQIMEIVKQSFDAQVE